jgi:hypothetical protein
MKPPRLCLELFSPGFSHLLSNKKCLSFLRLAIHATEGRFHFSFPVESNRKTSVSNFLQSFYSHSQFYGTQLLFCLHKRNKKIFKNNKRHDK